jgi:nucleotide-binding universal stress UspA family protein
VGVNGSAESLAAVGWLGDHPAAFPHVDAVFSAEPFLEWVPPSDPRSWHSEALRSLKEWVEPLHGGGLDVTTDVVRDVNPVAALLNRAQATGARTVVVGARPLGEVLRLRVGHSGMQLLHHSPLPTILVPATSTSTGP